MTQAFCEWRFYAAVDHHRRAAHAFRLDGSSRYSLCGRKKLVHVTSWLPTVPAIPRCKGCEARLEPTKQVGETHTGTALTDASVILMRRERAAGALVTELAERFKVSAASVSKICTGTAWTHVGGPLTRRDTTKEDITP